MENVSAHGLRVMGKNHENKSFSHQRDIFFSDWTYTTSYESNHFMPFDSCIIFLERIPVHISHEYKDII